ncbi:DUF2680 domain-containing protein [Thermohalobacter berrensis]|uniref:DUF2680 domain-containing protein n=1 Tax=Thermohalobacter berrensis TaxID=99594 RepID=A0A419SZC2_9FIRM|nr:DUF2680 domain-containing protein [Thermohalobacter berrensis]RKD30610.1 hypothetical protein BET03_04535 [Thermohalobacter berrensis]
MKKILGLSLVVVLVLTMGIVAFAADNDEVPNWFKEMIEWRKEQVKDALEEGYITEEQAKAWEEHFEYMEEFHSTNGFGFPGGCHRFGPRGYKRGFGNRQGFGPGMMNSPFFNYNR